MNEVKVTVGGEEHRLRYDFNALCELEAALGGGRSVLDVIAGLADLRWRDLRALLWVGMIHEDRAPGLLQVGGWIQADLAKLQKPSEHRRYYADQYRAINDALVRSGVIADPTKEGEPKDKPEGNAEAAATAP